MKKTDSFQTSNPETVTISQAEYEEKTAQLASQSERIAELEQQVSVLMEALHLARHGKLLVQYLEHQIDGCQSPVCVMLEEDRLCLQMMPHYTPDVSQKAYPTVSRYSTVLFETNSYSVSYRYTG